MGNLGCVMKYRYLIATPVLRTGAIALAIGLAAVGPASAQQYGQRSGSVAVDWSAIEQLSRGDGAAGRPTEQRPAVRKPPPAQSAKPQASQPSRPAAAPAAPSTAAASKPATTERRSSTATQAPAKPAARTPQPAPPPAPVVLRQPPPSDPGRASPAAAPAPVPAPGLVPPQATNAGAVRLTAPTAPAATPPQAPAAMTPPPAVPPSVLAAPAAAPAPVRLAAPPPAVPPPPVPSSAAAPPAAAPPVVQPVPAPAVPVLATPTPILAPSASTMAAPAAAAAAGSAASAVPAAASAALANRPDATTPVPGGSARLGFVGDGAELTAETRGQLRGIVEQLRKGPDARLRIEGFASGEDANRARRLSLSRALAVRAYLMDEGLSSTRMDVYARGTQTEGGPTDRVDLTVFRR
jgi:hypothetical protein